MKKKICIVLVGPTAVGKTSMAIALARHFKTSIISADSRQCFRELNIGVAKPSEDQLQLVKHYFINAYSIHDEVTASIFEQYALNAAQEIFQHKEVVVLTGGTGLYIKAFCEGMDKIPDAPADLRASIIDNYEREGLAWLQKEVNEKDPDYFASGEIKNPQRLMRALEVKMSTGESIRYFQQGKKLERDFQIIKVGLDLPRKELYHNINCRVDAMMEQGLLDEVTALVPYQHLNALSTVGYTELFSFLRGNSSLEKAIEAIKRNTRHYAKRQLTWFHKDSQVQWYSSIDPNQVFSGLQNLV